MGNPHPTKSKPCKIGWRHSGAPSTRQREKRRRGLEIYRLAQQAKAKKRRDKITELIRQYYAGERDEFPETPK